MIKIRQKRVKLDNGKTIIIDVPANNDGKNPFKEVARLMSTIPNLQPCDQSYTGIISRYLMQKEPFIEALDYIGFDGLAVSTIIKIELTH